MIIKCIYFYVVIGVNYADVCKLRLLHSAIITFLCNLSKIFAVYYIYALEKYEFEKHHLYNVLIAFSMLTHGIDFCERESRIKRL